MIIRVIRGYKMKTPAFSIYNASAGSGKTYTLVKEYLKIILKAKHNDAYRNILAITFTNKAAAEMQERISKLLGKKPKVKPLISTFHAYCVRVLRRQIRRLGYPEKFAIYDRGDQENIARQALREIQAFSR